MDDHNKIFVDTSITDCGTADWLAEIAVDLQHAAGCLNHRRLMEATDILIEQIARYAGIQDNHVKYIKPVLGDRWNDGQ